LEIYFAKTKHSKNKHILISSSNKRFVPHFWYNDFWSFFLCHHDRKNLQGRPENATKVLQCHIGCYAPDDDDDDDDDDDGYDDDDDDDNDDDGGDGDDDGDDGQGHSSLCITIAIL
jgi:hypothetical protein